MLQAVLLASLGVDELDGNGQDIAQARDHAAGVTWLVIVNAWPGGDVIGNLIRADPGTMGRPLFHFHTAPRDGRHALDYPCSGDGLASDVLPPLSALCSFFGAVRAAIVAGQVPDLATLAPLHLGVAYTVPPIELQPGDREIQLWFSARDDG